MQSINITENGTFRNNFILGNQRDELILGLDGDDTIYGFDGNDTVRGGKGYDRLFGGNGSDILNGGDDDDFLNGGNGNDLLIGGNGSDILKGGSGNDTLIGVSNSQNGIRAFENDILTGGSGRDKFVLGDANGVFYEERFAADGDNYALITDFNENYDVIQLSGSIESYRLDFVTSDSGQIDAHIILDYPDSNLPETIGVVENASTDLSLESSAFIFV
jgi:Ca2+-binding RTX toxin-like protein